MTNILFPIETIVRELDYRLLLAAKVLKKGRRVFICNHRHLDKIMKHFRGGVYVGKHISPSLSTLENKKTKRYAEAKGLGFNIVYLHEEDAIFEGMPADWEKYLTSRFDLHGFDGNDRLCAWGKWQESIFAKLNADVPIRVTGHPRFDLCKERYRVYYKDQVDQLKDTYGSYILINGNYSIPNCGGRGLGLIFTPRMGYNPDDPEKRQRFVDFYAHSTKSMVDMISLVHRLSTAFPEKTLIYRSHPSEGDHLYKHVFSGLHNVKRIHEGAIGPWLLAAETIIHDGCTTAIEASFSNAHVIKYCLNESIENDIRLPSLVGLKARSPEAVIVAIKQRDTKSIDVTVQEELSSMIDNYNNDSFNLLSDAIEEALESSANNAKRSPNTVTLRSEYATYMLKRNIKTLISKRKGKTKEYQNKKFPGFDLSTIKNKIRNAGQVMDTEMRLVYANPLLLVLEGRKKG